MCQILLELYTNVKSGEFMWIYSCIIEEPKPLALNLFTIVGNMQYDLYGPKTVTWATDVCWSGCKLRTTDINQ